MSGGRARTALVTAAIIVAAPVLGLLMLVVHETGHTVVAWALGDGRATFILYGNGCVGCNLYDSQRMSAWGNVAVNLGGVWGTITLTLLAVALLSWGRRPRWLPRWLLAELVLICYFGDFVWQFVQALQQLPVPAREPVGWAQEYTDFDAATSFATQATGWSHRMVAIIGLAAAVVYTVLLAFWLVRAWRRPHRTIPSGEGAGPRLRWAGPGGARPM